MRSQHACFYCSKAALYWNRRYIGKSPRRLLRLTGETTEDHKTDFMPAFLANDILRLWRTFCVNYEARTARVPEEQKAKGKLHNYKLKHSRLLTCYSALLYLLAVYEVQRTVSLSDAMGMIRLTPTERLKWLLDRGDLAEAHGLIKDLLQRYEHFLDTTNASESELLGKFIDKKTGQSYMSAAYKFGDLVFEVLTKIGNGNPFHRVLVVLASASCIERLLGLAVDRFVFAVAN